MQKAITLILIVFLLSIGTLSAQSSFTVSSDSVTGISSANRPDYILRTTLANPSTTQSVSIKWKRFENAYNPSWTGNQICISNANCNDIDTGTVILGPSGSATFDAKFVTDSLTGTGYMRVRFYDETDSATSQKVTFFGVTLNNPTTSISSPASSGSVSDIQIYPNPAKEFVIIKRPDNMSVSRIEVYNMLGLKVITQYAELDNSSSRIDLLDLQKGVYMIRIFDKNNNVILTKSISKIR
ncbi:hypothetical protein BH09BAC1_BH09BAC1_16670 [soil metagenome]